LEPVNESNGFLVKRFNGTMKYNIKNGSLNCL